MLMYFLAPCCIRNFRRRRLASKPSGAGEATTSRRYGILFSLQAHDSHDVHFPSVYACTLFIRDHCVSRPLVRLLCRVASSGTTAESTARAAHVHAQWPHNLHLEHAAASTASLQRHDRAALAMSFGGDTSTYRAPGPPSDASTLTIANLTGHPLFVQTPRDYVHACRQSDGDASLPS